MPAPVQNPAAPLAVFICTSCCNLFLARGINTQVCHSCGTGSFRMVELSRYPALLAHSEDYCGACYQIGPFPLISTRCPATCADHHVITLPKEILRCLSAEASKPASKQESTDSGSDKPSLSSSPTESEPSTTPSTTPASSTPNS